MFLGQVSRAWVSRVQPWEQEVTLGEEEEMEWGDLWHRGVEEGRRSVSLRDWERLEKLLAPLEESDEEESEEEKKSLEDEEREEEKQSPEEEEREGEKQGLEEEETEGEKQSLGEEEREGEGLEEERSLELRLSDSSGENGSSISGEHLGKVGEASDSQSDNSQFKAAKLSSDFRKLQEKSEYEKLRDINIAERKKALCESGLLKEISYYKKKYLGKVKKARLPEDGTRSVVGSRVKMSQCRLRWFRKRTFVEN